MPDTGCVCLGDNYTECTRDEDCQDVGGPCTWEHSGRDNDGCRLTRDEIWRFVEQLYDSAPQLGAINFTPDFDPESQQPPIHEIEDPYLDDRMHTTDQFFLWIDTVNNPPTWTAGHLNIYFAGNVQEEGQWTKASAWDLDPRDAGAGGQNHKPCIVVNDGGFNLYAEGFVPSHIPPSRVHGDVIEHEFAHHMLTRQNCCAYDSGEHLPYDTVHLLRDHTTGPYGFRKWVVLEQNELDEISCRHTSGSWVQAVDECTNCPCPP